MAKFKITSLNYIAHGNDRTMINMDVDRYNAADLIYVVRQEDQPRGREPISGDVLLEQGAGKYIPKDFISKEFKKRPSLDHALSKEEKLDDIILTEQFRYFQENDPDVKGYVRLYLDDNYSGLRDNLIKFNSGRHMVNQTFELENIQQNESENQLVASGVTKAIYDITDVALKSRNTSYNVNIPKFDARLSTEDIYLPNSPTMPLGFCQVETNSYLLTDSTKDQPLYLRSSLNFSDESVYKNTTFQHLKLNSDGVKTYIYTPLEVLSADSYAEYYSEHSMSDFFLPKANLSGVNYNYIAAIPLDGNTSLTTDYEMGNVYGYFYTTKNMYNSTYSMDMSSMMKLGNCRQYLQIEKCANVPYLKYYDNMDYLRDKPVDLELTSRTVTDVKYYTKDRNKVPYQKIETFCPITYNSQTLHKPTMFSVKLNSTGLDPANDQYAKLEASEEVADEVIKIRNNIRQDITNTIREIAKNVCPAHTQLFDVFFEG